MGRMLHENKITKAFEHRRISVSEVVGIRANISNPLLFKHEAARVGLFNKWPYARNSKGSLFKSCPLLCYSYCYFERERQKYYI